MKHASALMLGALAQAVAGKPFSMPESVDWQQLLRLSQAHSVEPLVYYGLQRAELLQAVPETCRQHLLAAFHRAVFRDSQFDHIREKLTRQLTDAGVRHVFLKGACLKYDYPVPALRTMCDLDVLVHTRDYPAIDRVAQNLGGQPGDGDGNHRIFRFPGGVTVEFHPNLLHHSIPVGAGINPGWQYARENANELTPEGFYLNTLCHLASHFVSGGVGVRFVLDVWVNRHLRSPDMDRAFVEAELKRLRLLEFARNIEALAECWFGEGQTTPLLEELGQYILTSGSHGQPERAMRNALALSPGKSRSSALLKKAFYPRQELEDRFPWCKGKPWLLPAAWCTRAYRAVTRRGHLIARWSKGTARISKEEIAEQARQLARFGIQIK